MTQATRQRLERKRRKKSRRRNRRNEIRSEFDSLSDFSKSDVCLIFNILRAESAEEGELESDHEMLNPLVSITKIDPSEIPEVSHKFLMRGDRRRDSRDVDKKDEKQKDRDRGFGWSKKSVPVSRSGRTIKGRGNFRYRTPSRSRSRSFTPEHWKAAQRNVIKMTDFERMEDEKRARESEVSRRAEERKKRHEALSKGDGKKSFFELTQDVPVTVTTVLTVASSLTRPERSGSVDLNALDYEESDSDKEPREKFKKNDEKNGKSVTRKDRSRSRERFSRDRRDDRSTVHNRFNDNKRWDNNRGGGRNRFESNRWRHSSDRRSRSLSKSPSR